MRRARLLARPVRPPARSRRQHGPTCREALGEYLEHMEAKGTTAKHRRDVAATIERFLDDRGVVRLEQLGHGDGVAWLNAERQRTISAGFGHKPRELPTLSLRSLNRQRQHLRAWSRWCWLTGHLEADPFARVPAAREQTDCRRQRRALTPDELRRLVAEPAAPENRPPLLRRAVYLTAAMTGLRRAELAALKPHEVRLDEGMILLPAAAAKNRRAARMALPPQVVDMLRRLDADREVALKEARAWCRRGTVREDVFIPTMPGNRTLYRDLEAVGIERETTDGVIDFHSLRVTFATLLARAGVCLQVAQQLMRHSDPKLTTGIYTRFGAIDDARRQPILELGAMLGGTP